jgi:AcrR family transcriptional regulator
VVGREDVLAVAAELFRTKGYAATTTRELAAGLGIEKGSLYYHIDSKEEVLYELIASTTNLNLERVEEAARQPGTPVERIRRTFAAHITGMHSDTNKNVTALLELRSVDGEQRAELIAVRDRYERVFQDIIEEGQRDGQIRADIPAHLLKLALLSMANYTLIWYRPDGELPAEELAETFTEIFLQGARA